MSYKPITIGDDIVNPLIRPDHNYNVIEDRKLTKPQQESVEFLLTHFNSILGLLPGMGKTFTMLTALKHIFNYKDTVVCAIVCPKAATTAFLKEAKLLSLPISVYTSEMKMTHQGSRLYLFNYTNLDMLAHLLESASKQNVKVIGVLDECHTLSNPEAKMYKNMKVLRSKFCCVYGMTATLYGNDLIGLYHMMDLIRPGYLGTLNDFKYKFVNYRERTIRVRGRSRKIQEVVGFKNMDILKSLIERVCIVRGKKYQLNFKEIKFNLSSYEEAQYKIAAQGLFGQDSSDDLFIEAQEYGPRIHNLQRVADGAVVEYKNGEQPTKIKYLLKMLKEICEKDQNCIVYTTYDDTFEFLLEWLKKCKDFVGYNQIFQISGKTPDKQRRKPETLMSCRDIVLATKAGSASINLQKANNIICYNLDFSILTMIQLIGRICRVDTKYPVQNLYFLTASKTIDEYKTILFNLHQTLISYIYGDIQTLPTVTLVDPEQALKIRNRAKQQMLWKRW